MNRSLQEKSAARLAAAQLLYKQALEPSAQGVEALIGEYAGLHESTVAPNKALLRKLLEGIAAHGEALEPWLDKCLTNDWKKSRMSPLLLSIMRLALFELAEFRNVATGVIVNEYVNLTARFFGEKETGFINAALNAVAIEMRNAGV